MTKRIFWLMVVCLIALSLVLSSGSVSAEQKTNWWDVYGEPQYGGTLTYRVTADPVQCDPYLRVVGTGSQLGSLIYENTALKDPLQDPSVWGFIVMYTMTRFNAGLLIESWEMPDNQTLIMHVRKGIRWQDIEPMNGREFTAKDLEFHYQRLLGLGYGYTERTKSNTMNPDILSTKSVKATDKYTIVFKAKFPNNLYEFAMVNWVGSYGLTMPREAVEKWGDLSDWKHSVGTGPFILKKYISGSSLTYVKNPNYWGYDERHPDNKLPYVDEVKVLIIPELATAMSALRSGKIDILEDISWEQAASLAKTNPELIQVRRPAFYSDAIGMRVDKKPFSDIRVRKAMQMAIPLKTINESYYGGTGDATPAGLMSHFYDSWGCSMPYADWSPEVKKGYAHNPEGAKKLLTEAGYPNGFDTTCVASSTSDLDLLTILKAYLKDININMEIQVMESTVHRRFVSDMNHDALYYPARCAHSDSPPVSINQFLTGFPLNYSGLGDPVYNDLHSKERATFDEAEQNRLIREMDYRVISQHWMVVTPMKVNFCIYQPWLKMYWGQQALRGPEFGRFWIDRELKKKMGK